MFKNIIIGNGGHAKVVRSILNDKEIYYYDDLFQNDSYYLGSIDKIISEHILVIAIGSNKIREKIVNQYPKIQWCDTPLSHHTSIIESHNIGKGVVICAGAIIQVNAKIGNHCIINTKASVDHDCILEDFVHIASGATLCGNVTVGKGTLIGAGSVVREKIIIGKNVIIGCGSVVVSNIPDDCIAFGNPCRIKSRDQTHH